MLMGAIRIANDAADGVAAINGFWAQDLLADMLNGTRRAAAASRQFGHA
jgi:hypothetical protein